MRKNDKVLSRGQLAFCQLPVITSEGLAKTEGVRDGWREWGKTSLSL